MAFDFVQRIPEQSDIAEGAMRAFLSLNPDSIVAMDIDRWSSQCWPTIGRRVPVQNLHVTVAFLGDISAHQHKKLLDLLSTGIGVAPFQMSFDKVGYWSQQGILWLGSSSVPTQLSQLVEQAKVAANRAGIRVNSKRYEPHFTLARKPPFPPPAPLIEPSFSMRFDSLQLCESFLDKRGARYMVRDSWALASV